MASIPFRDMCCCPNCTAHVCGCGCGIELSAMGDETIWFDNHGAALVREAAA